MGIERKWEDFQNQSVCGDAAMEVGIWMGCGGEASFRWSSS